MADDATVVAEAKAKAEEQTRAAKQAEEAAAAAKTAEAKAINEEMQARAETRKNAKPWKPGDEGPPPMVPGDADTDRRNNLCQEGSQNRITTNEDRVGNKCPTNFESNPSNYPVESEYNYWWETICCQPNP